MPLSTLADAPHFARDGFTFSATVAEREVSAGPGDAIIVPAHAALQIRNDSAEHPARLTAATSVGMRALVGGAVFTPPWAQ